MIIGLHGRKGSGKDTVAAYLIKEHRFQRKAFADPLKRSVAKMFDIPFHKIDEWKNDPLIRIEVVQYPDENSTRHPDKSWQFIRSSQTLGEFLQSYGQGMREVFGENFWVDQCLPTNSYYDNKDIVISDCRYANEAMRINQLGGFVVEVDRPDIDRPDARDPNHISERPLPPTLIDFTILNHSSILDLYERTERMLDHFNKSDQRIKAILRQ